MQELDEISHWVRTQVVPRLLTGTEPPEPALLTRYEIALGHQDERRAMAKGSTTSASDRHKHRCAGSTVTMESTALARQFTDSAFVASTGALAAANAASLAAAVFCPSPALAGCG